MSRGIWGVRRTFLLTAGLLCGAAVIGAEPAPLPILPLVLKPVLYGHLPFWDVKSTTASTVGGSSGGSSPAGAGDAVLVLSTTGFVDRIGANAYITRSLTADIGVTISNTDGVSGNPTIGTDAAIIPVFSTAAGDPSANCGVGTTDYINTTDHTFWKCNNTNTWALSSLGNNFLQFTGPTTSRKTFTLPDASATIVTTNGGADDKIPVGDSGSAYTWRAVPDCTDATGNHLNYTASTNSFSCGTSSSSSTFDPSTTFTQYEDFSGGNTTSGQIGTTGVLFTALSTGTVTNNFNAAGNPSLLRLLSHATNDNSGIILGLATASGFNSSMWSNKTWTLDAVIIPGSNSTSSTTAAMYFGLANTSTTELAANATRGVWIRWDSDLSDAHYQFVICNAAGAAGCNSAASAANAQVTASTINAVAGTANRLRIRHATSGVGGLDTIYFRVNDETEKTACSSGCDITQGTYTATNFNTTFEYVTRNTTGVISGDIDYFYMTVSGLVRY